MSLLSPTVSLAVALVSLLAWIVLAFVAGATAGAVHALLALGVIFVVRWYALAR
jgi:hypothetical protein